jgi:hypothetical protein
VLARYLTFIKYFEPDIKVDLSLLLNVERVQDKLKLNIYNNYIKFFVNSIKIHTSLQIQSEIKQRFLMR